MLEKILEEIEAEKLKHWDPSESLDTDKIIGWCFEKCKNIIRKHMSIGKDINVHTNNNWIPVEERLPEDDRYVLVCNVRGARDLAWWDGNGKRWWTGFSHADIARDVIAWQPLPDPYTLKKETETDCFKVPVDTACLIRSRQN